MRTISDNTLSIPTFSVDDIQDDRITDKSIIERLVRNMVLVKNGIYLAGGGALLRGLDKRLTDKIGIKFHIAEDPLLAVAKGTGVALKNIERFNFLIR